MWACRNCQEQIDDDFDLCWNCGTASDGTPSPDFSVDSIATSHGDAADVVPLQFGIRHVLGLMTIVALAATLGITMFFATLIGIVLLALAGFALWFIFWALAYLVAGRRDVVNRERRDSDSIPPVNLWHARKQADGKTEEGEQQ